MRGNVRAVAFDYGRVLSGPQNDAAVARMHTLTRIAPDAFEEHYRVERLAYDRGDVSSDEYWTNILRASRTPATPALLDALRAADAESWLDIDAQVLAWARAIAQRGVGISILSNMPAAVLAPILARHGEWLREFPVRIFSCEVRCVKPDREIYDLLLDRIRVPADEVLFLDDKSENIDTARRIGMQGVVFDGPETLLTLTEV